MNVFVIDPGTKTGLAWGRIGDHGLVGMRLKGRRIQSETIDGHYVRQANIVCQRLHEFCKDIPKSRFPVHIVIEDFILRQMTMDRELLDPVRVTAACVTAIAAGMGSVPGSHEFHFQQPSEASVYNNDRLRHFGLWVKGADSALEHQRDARRHLIKFVADAVKLEFDQASA